MRRKICVFTGTRADYGLLEPLINELRNEPGVELQLLVTGMHMSPEFGLTHHDVDTAGCHSVEKVDMERADYWLSQGAQPSETVSAIIKRCRANVSLAEQKGTQEGRDYIHAGQQQKPKTRAVEDTEEAPAEGGEETTEESAAETEETVAEDSAASESDNQDKTA